MGTILIAGIVLLVGMAVARMAIALLRFAIIIVVAIVAVFAGLSIVRTGSTFASIAHRTFGHAGASAAVAIGAAALIVTLAVIGALTVHGRIRAALQPFMTARKLDDAANRLRRAGAAVTAASLSHIAHVDRGTALAWISLHPQYMPSVGTFGFAQAKPRR